MFRQLLWQNAIWNRTLSSWFVLNFVKQAFPGCHGDYRNVMPSDTLLDFTNSSRPVTRKCVTIELLPMYEWEDKYSLCGRFQPPILWQRHMSNYYIILRCIWKADYSEVLYNERVLPQPEARVRTLLQRWGLWLGMRLLLSPWQVQYPHRFRNNIAAVTQVRALITNIGLRFYFIANNSREQMHSCRDINYLKSNFIQ